MADTLNFGQLLEHLIDLNGGAKLEKPVRLIIGGIAYPVTQVWFEPRQDGTGAVCIGDDPR